MSTLSAQLRLVEQTGTGLYRRARRALGLPPVAPRTTPVEPVAEPSPAVAAPEERAREAMRLAARAATEPAARRNAFTLTIQILPLVVFVALVIIFAAWIPELQRMY